MYKIIQFEYPNEPYFHSSSEYLIMRDLFFTTSVEQFLINR